MFSILDQGAKCFKRKKKRDRKTTPCRIGLYRNKTLLDLFGTWSCILVHITCRLDSRHNMLLCNSVNRMSIERMKGWLNGRVIFQDTFGWLNNKALSLGWGWGGVILVHVQEEWIFMHKLLASCIRIFSFFSLALYSCTFTKIDNFSTYFSAYM